MTHSNVHFKDHSGCCDNMVCSPQPSILRATPTVQSSNAELFISGHNFLFSSVIADTSGHLFFYFMETSSGFLTLLSPYSPILSFSLLPYLAEGDPEPAIPKYATLTY